MLTRKHTTTWRLIKARRKSGQTYEYLAWQANVAYWDAHQAPGGPFRLDAGFLARERTECKALLDALNRRGILPPDHTAF